MRQGADLVHNQAMPESQLDRIEHRLTRIEAGQDRIEAGLDNLLRLGLLTLREEIKMGTKFDALNEKVTELETVQEGAVTLLGTLAQEIRDNAGDPVAIAALADRIDADKQKLADAVAANTPAA